MVAYISSVPAKVSVKPTGFNDVSVSSGGEPEYEGLAAHPFVVDVRHEGIGGAQVRELREFHDENRTELVEINAPDGAAYEGYMEGPYETKPIRPGSNLNSSHIRLGCSRR